MQVAEHHVSSKFKLFPDKTYIAGKWVDSASSNTFEVRKLRKMRLKLD